MEKTLLVVGFGPGISTAVAEKFGTSGYRLAIAARNKDKLDAAVKSLQTRGVNATAFVADATDPAAVGALVERVRGSLGPLSAIHWNAYGGGPKPLADATVADFDAAVTVATKSLLTAVQAALPDLTANKGAVLITNGGFGFVEPGLDRFVASAGFGLLGIANAAKHKLAAVLHHELAPRGVYVADVMVTGTVKGTAWDDGTATIEAGHVATRFWSLLQERKESTATV